MILGGVFLSTSGLGVRALEVASGLQIIMYRSLGMGLFISAVVFLRYQRRSVEALRNTGRYGLSAGLLFSLASVFVIFALLHTSVANAMFIISLAPFFAAIGGWLLLKENVAMKTWGCMLLAIVGVLIMVEGGISRDGWLGIAFALAMAVSYGLFTVALRAGKDRDLLPAVGLSGFGLSLACFISIGPQSLPVNEIAICLAMGIIQTGLGSMCLTHGALHVPAAQVTLLAMLEVVLNPIWVWLAFGETPALLTLVGGTVILIAIGLQAQDNSANGGSHD